MEKKEETKKVVNPIEEEKRRLQEFVESIKGKSKEELEALEEELIKQADEADKACSEYEFDVPTAKYQEVARAIRYFLDKQTVQWQFTLGMKSLYDFWDTKRPAKLPYPILDTTLRNLGGLQFTGYDEWCKVLIINEYFESMREKYTELARKPYEIAGKHDAVMNALGLQNPISGTDEGPLEELEPVE